MKLVMVTIDCRDASALAGWYVDVFGGGVVHDYEGMFVMADVAGTRLGFQKVDDLGSGKNRVHLDFHTETGLADQVSAAAAKGAQHKGDFGMPGLKWATLEDPEGNLFDIGQTE